MQMNMVNDFASMLQWLMTVLPQIHKARLFCCRVKSSVISRSAPVAPMSRRHIFVLAADHATCLQCSQVSDGFTRLSVRSVKLWRPDFPCTVSSLVHVPPGAIIGTLESPSAVILVKVNTVTTRWDEAVGEPRLPRRHSIAQALVHVCEQ